MGWFDFQRQEGFPTNYEAHHNAVNADVAVSGIICAVLILLVACLTILPAYKSKAIFLYRLIYIFVSIFIGGSLLVGNYGHEWETGEIKIKTPYKPTSSEEIVADLGLYVALRGVNITLRGSASENSTELKTEIINYNEHFSWEWAQGRFGFGPYAGRISQDFRTAVALGVPIPILQLAEYFTFDGEGLRFGRHYRQAGYFSHFFMWCAFVAWVLTNILFLFNVFHGGFLLLLTGIFQIIAMLIWTCNRNSIEISVPFESADGKGEVSLHTRFGSDYYVVLFNGILCCLTGIVVCVMEIYFPKKVYAFFCVNPMTAFREMFLPIDEVKPEIDAVSTTLSRHEGERSVSDRIRLVTVRLRKGETYAFFRRSKTILPDADNENRIRDSSV